MKIAKFTLATIITALVLFLGSQSFRRIYRDLNCKEDLVNIVQFNKKIFELGGIIIVEATNSVALNQADPKISKLQYLKHEFDKLTSSNPIQLIDPGIHEYYLKIEEFENLGSELLNLRDFEKKRPERAHLKSVSFNDLNNQWTYELAILKKTLKKANRPFLCK